MFGACKHSNGDKANASFAYRFTRLSHSLVLAVCGFNGLVGLHDN